MARVSGRLVLYLVVSLFANGFSLPSGEIGESTEETLIAMREEVNVLKAQMRALVGESLDQKRAIDELDVRERRDAETPHKQTDSIVRGAVYTRWGRSDCRDGSDLVYAGVSAGSHFTHSGSGSNYLCLPLEPIYDEYVAASTEYRGLLYSAEYQTETTFPRLVPLNDHTPVCAVCRAPPGRTNKLMIPARNDCPSEEWRLEYGGYLMSSYHRHHRNEYVCVDREMEAEPGTYGNQEGVLFHMVEAVCMIGAGIPCDPYKSGRELTCAVCTI